MKLITFDDIAALGITPAQCIDWVSYSIAHKAEAILPAKMSIHPGGNENFCNVMPSIVPGVGNISRGGGVKIVTRYPDRTPALDSKLLLFNADTGEMLALMDADWITAMRTGAVAAHSINLFAQPDFTEIAILGLGNTARSTMLMLAETRHGRDVNVRLLRYKGQEDSFQKRFECYPNLHFSCVDSMKELVVGAQVVISCVTYFGDDVCEDAWFDEGVTLLPVHTRGFTNCDLFFDKVFADDTGHVCGFKNFDQFRSFSEVADVVAGNAAGRQSANERILVYNIGLSIHDVAFAERIYELIDKTSLQDIDLKQPEAKFWL